MCFIVATKRPAQAFAVSYLIVYSFVLPFIFAVCRLFAPCLIGAGRSGFYPNMCFKMSSSLCSLKVSKLTNFAPLQMRSAAAVSSFLSVTV